MDKELEWKWIKGFEGMYKIYIDGSVYSIITKRFRKTTLQYRGYYKVMLTIPITKEQKGFFIHRLIALHFIENPNNYKEVDHINRIRTDNRVENLRWASRSMNMRNRIQTKKKTNKTGYVGVTFDKGIEKYRAFIFDKKQYKNIRIGNFNTALEASIAYNEVAKKMFGELAYQN